MEQAVYVITGATGHVGGRIADRLLTKRRKVRVIGRSEERLKPLASRGAETAVGSVEDPAFLSRAFEGATAAFLMIPPNYQATDHHGYQHRVAAAYAEAVRATGVGHLVTLSSIGAQLTERTGPILGLHDMEQVLDRLDGVNLLHLRPASFMENHFHAIGSIRQMDAYLSAMHPDRAIPQIATRDIADVAVDLMLSLDFQGRSTRELHGQRDLTISEVTKVLGPAIGKPRLAYTQVSYEAAQQALVQMGMTENAAGLMVEMIRGFNEDYIKPVEKRSQANTTSTSIEDFAREDFATAWSAGG